MADENVVVADPEVLPPEISEDRRELLQARRTTAEEQESNAGAASENQRHEDTRAIMQKLGEDNNRAIMQGWRDLGHDSDWYRRQIDALPAEQRSALKGKSGADIAAYLDDAADGERQQKRQQEELDRQAAEAAEAQFNETPALREMRHTIKAGREDVAALKKDIAHLEKWETLRKDRNGSGSEEMLTPEEHGLWRQGLLRDRSGELQAKVARLQATLQETDFAQNAYFHEAARMQAPSPPSIVQIVDNHGQPIMQIPAAKYEELRQYDRQQDAHTQRMQEASQRNPDYERALRQSAQAWGHMGDGAKAYIRSFDDVSTDIEFHLSTHPEDMARIVALTRMGRDGEAQLEINRIAVKAGGRRNAHEAPRSTSAPKPPTPVTNGYSSREFNVNDESTTPEEWRRGRTRDIERRRNNRHS